MQCHWITFHYRLKEEEVRLRKEEIEQLIIDYGRLEQQIKMLE